MAELVEGQVEPTQEVSEEPQVEQPTEEVAAAPEEDGGPKGEPSDEQRDNRLTKEKEEYRLQAEYWQRQAQLKPMQQIPNPAQPQNVPLEEKLFGKDDEDFVSVGQVKQLVQNVIKPIAMRQAGAERQSEQQTLTSIDERGREMYDDYMEVASHTASAMNSDPALKKSILGAPDPAAMAYTYGSQILGRREQDAAAGKAQKIVRNSKAIKTLAGVSGSSGTGSMTIDRLMAMPPDEYRKQPKDVREKAYAEARDAGRL